MPKDDSWGWIFDLGLIPFQLAAISVLQKSQKNRLDREAERIFEEDWGEFLPKDEEVPYEFTNV